MVFLTRITRRAHGAHYFWNCSVGILETENLQFPYHIFHPKNLQSLARRASDVCRWSAYQCAPTFRHSGETTDQFTYLTLACQRDLAMTRISLATMCRWAKQLPKLTIAYDGSLSRNQLECEFSEWRGPIEFWSREMTEDKMRTLRVPYLADFCRNHIFGFKFAACMLASYNKRVVYSDADVLWFGDCADLMAKYRSGSLHGSFDIGKSLDSDVLQMMDSTTANLVSQAPWVCAGFVVYNKPLIRHSLITEVVGNINRQKQIGRFAEQTLVAALVRAEGGMIASENVRMVEPNSACLFQNPRDSANFAKHYPDTERPQFWIDSWKAAFPRRPHKSAYNKVPIG